MDFCGFKFMLCQNPNNILIICTMWISICFVSKPVLWSPYRLAIFTTQKSVKNHSKNVPKMMNKKNRCDITEMQ
jgi:hypothetical protein